MAEFAGAGCFVTGTDTGVGKTVVSCALIRELRARGFGVGAIKPIETGVGPDGPLDAIALRDAAGTSDALEIVCPQQFALPAAPNIAASAEARDVDLAVIEAAFQRISDRRDFVLAEGAGGLLVPIRDHFTMADLAQNLGLPLLIVARAALGTINHTLLTLEAAATRKLQLLGVVISHAAGKLSDADAANLSALRSELGDQLIGEIPPLEIGAGPPPDAISPIAEVVTSKRSAPDPLIA
jgi:dethiobiotin synthetase